MGIRDKPIVPASPWQNGFAERLIGSIRRRCVDHLIVLGEAHLRRILRTYARYYKEITTHWSLDKDAPVLPHSADRKHWVTRHPWRAPSPLRPGLGFRYRQPKIQIRQPRVATVLAQALFLAVQFLHLHHRASSEAHRALHSPS
jgi:hypothetical protein